MRYAVTAPSTNRVPPRPFSGTVAGVRFDNGIATADSETDRAALAYFRRHGYRVEPQDAEQASPAEGTEPTETEQTAAAGGEPKRRRGGPTRRETS